MTKCPKCGSLYILGPKFESACFDGKFYSQERLRYTCERCGYSMTTATNDAEEQKRRKA